MDIGIKIKDKLKVNRVLDAVNYILLSVIVLVAFNGVIHMDSTLSTADLIKQNLGSDIFWAIGVYVQVLIAYQLMDISTTMRTFIKKDKK
jgi:hypothetical protein